MAPSMARPHITIDKVHNAGVRQISATYFRPNPNSCWPTLRIWISSDPSVMR